MVKQQHPEAAAKPRHWEKKDYQNQPSKDISMPRICESISRASAVFSANEPDSMSADNCKFTDLIKSEHFIIVRF